MIFRFESPWLLSLLLLVPLLATWPLLAKKWSRPASLRYADVKLAGSSNGSWRVALRPILTVLRILAVALIIGVAVSLFTAVTVTRLFVNLVMNTALARNVSLFGVSPREVGEA